MRQELIDALGKAVKREQASHKLYLSLLRKAENSNTKSLFRQLSIEELKHEALLREFEKTADFIEAKEKISMMYMVDNIRIADGILASSSTMGLREGMDLALEKERNAAEYYEGLREKSVSESEKDLFSELIEEEHRHERLLRKEYDKIFS